MFWENIRQALHAIRSNLLRAGITILIIAFGIMAIVGVLTSIDSIKYWMASSFTTLGANTFKIQNRQGNFRIGGARTKRIQYPEITFLEASQIKEKLQNLGIPANINAVANQAGRAKYLNFVTNNNIAIKGTDENFLVVEGYKIAEGRSITQEDVEFGRNVVVIGHDVQEKIFPGIYPIDKMITLDKRPYRVIGVLEKRGTSFGGGGDKVAIIPITSMRKSFIDTKRSYTVNAYVDNPEKIDYWMQVTTGLFRVVRKLKPNEENNFVIVKSDSFVESLMENLALLTLSATAIALITLFGASIGLMNIMLVSVVERTKEIGLRKALGATQNHILLQFLVEAVVICQLGGIVGTLMGIGMGNLIGYFLGNEFIIPWNWVLLSFAICFFVGVISGLYPARKAAQLDPIEALRYE
ncbi:MAG: ABC transporter permease [Bacteroidia bacterium]|nr:MAG: ABC transporter permease [Bacteroidia bacterium]